MTSYIDLHMHSMYSDDGEFTPTSLVEQCAAAGVRVMAIADHNWVKAIDEEKEAAEKYGIKVIPAIEIDCTWNSLNFHVLGYGIDYNRPEFNELGESIEKQALALQTIFLDKINALGFEVRKEQIDAVCTNGVYTGEGFAEVLLADERYTGNELLKPYRAGGTRSDNPYVNFYWDYCSQGKPCYVEIHYPTVEEIIALIHDAGGKAVLAHPGNNLKGHFDYFDDMCALGFDGVEAFSSYHSQETIDYFYNKGKEHGLMITCGSDFHGKTKPAIFLGENGCEDPDEVAEYLKETGLLA